ncbi:PREDICTED: nuclear receptor 2C2-associated protein-like [Priapulus caudatus]|uniref:Nuclear receptor 2C2-associated protein-like n=1 Tax=Priapulus caudatus TaxID=37621 RepID=A0ABM1F0Z6_PRICU|nr:PREDICTED: nuclear receptor 2C2-associated protein-like [Priapulus caudatus]
MTDSLLASARVSVSSVLNRNVKEFGKQFLIDGSDETCWNSDEGLPQWVLLRFLHPVLIARLCVRFQGGFAGRECHLEGGDSPQTLRRLADFYPEDVNALQTFDVRAQQPVSVARLVFASSTDFYGRVVVYSLDLLGDCA